MADRPPPEIDLTASLARALLTDQHRQLADLDLVDFSRGWDNTMYRLGSDLMLRLPHRQAAANLILNEQRWLPTLAPGLDLRVPTPTHIGTPTSFYPWAWSVVPWIEGTEAATATVTDPASTARRLGTFFAQLHQPAPPHAPLNPWRGVVLATRTGSFATNLAMVGHPYSARIRAIFDTAASITATTERVWVHGDLHPRNLVVHGGDLVAAIDWGDICGGDRATDLAAAFMLVPQHLEIVRAHAGADDAAWERARGWATHFAVTYLAHGDDDPVMAHIGQRLLDVVLLH